MIKKFTFAIVVIGLVFQSCNTNNTQKGAGVGAAAGGVLGAVLGNNIGNKNNSELGAVLGAVIGGAAGGLIGNKMDKQAEEIGKAIPGAEVERVGEAIKLTLNENAINFDFGKASLTSQAKQHLDNLVPIFQKYEDTYILIVGHTDSKGSDEFNQKLSEQRANSVSAYLANKGIESSRLSTMGAGEANPIADNETDEGRAKNRRVEFGITANEDMIKEAQESAGN